MGNKDWIDVSELMIKCKKCKVEFICFTKGVELCEECYEE